MNTTWFQETANRIKVVCPDGEFALTKGTTIEINLDVSQERGVVTTRSGEFLALSPAGQVFQIIATVKLMKDSPKPLPSSPPVMLIMNQQTRF